MLRRNVLIFHQGALGDFVLTWPLALALSRIYPQSRILYVTAGEKAKLAEKVLGVESSDIESGWSALFAAGELPPISAKMLAGASAIYSFLGSNSTWTQNVARLNSEAKLVQLEGKPPEEFAGHASDWLVQQLQPHQVEQTALQQILRSIADRGVGFRRSPGDEIFIHPGSGGVSKCWPLDQFFELTRLLKSSGRKVRFITGEVERERWSTADFDAMAKLADVRQPSTYLELLNELTTAAIFIGNDSGPGHLAGIIGVPTVSIFTTTDAAHWRPLGPRVQSKLNPTSDDVARLIQSS